MNIITDAISAIAQTITGFITSSESKIETVKTELTELINTKINEAQAKTATEFNTINETIATLSSSLGGNIELTEQNTTDIAAMQDALRAYDGDTATTDTTTDADEASA